MLVPATRYRDPEAAFRFILDVLQLEEHAVYRSENGKIQHAQVTLGTGMMMFGPGAEGSDFDRLMADPSEIGGRETTTIYAVVPDVARRFDHVVAAGARVLMALAAQPYGGSSFTIADPEGHIWTFGDYDPRGAQG
jgi:uncharacterized glyoxalase superfamily protein PhnB